MAIIKKKTEEKSAKSGKDDVVTTTSSTSVAKIPTVLVQPRLSEKSGRLAAINKYVFKVKTDANKVEVKKAVENTYKVKVIQVNMVINQGKTRNFGRTTGRTQAFKKAIVTLKAGDKIEGLTDIV